MKLKFDPSLQYQHDAIEAVVNVFDGQPFVQTGAMAFQSLQIGDCFRPNSAWVTCSICRMMCF